MSQMEQENASAAPATPAATRATPPNAPYPYALDEGDVFLPPKAQRNPWVLAGALTTAAILFAGIAAFKAGNTKLSQHMMRARVLAQGGTIAIMLASVGGLVATEREGDKSSPEKPQA